jgi:ribosomal protein S27E
MVHLYPVEPQGLGTLNIESLSSYLLRVASAHSTTVGVLLRTLCDQDSYGAQRDIARVQHAPLTILIRPSETTASAIKVLAEATELPINSLMSMTMMALYKAVRRPLRFFAPNLQWCACCIREQKRADRTVYFKLIWMFHDLGVCPDHQCDLRDRCPSCSRFQTSVARSHSIGSCTYCGADLAGDDGPTPSAMKELSAANEILNLVGYVSANPGSEFPRAGFGKALRILLREASHAHASHLLCAALGTELFKYSDSTIPNVFYVSSILHVPAVNLLLGDVQGTNLDLLRSHGSVESGRPQFRRESWRDRAAIEDKAHAYFYSFRDGPHPSLAAVAQHVGMSASGFRYLCERLAHDIIEMRHREGILRRAGLGESLSKRVHELIASRAEEGVMPLGRKKLVNQLLKEARWSKNSIREEVRLAFDAMESRDL